MSDSREALLDAAWELTVELFGSADESERPPRILDQLTTSDIARRAGLTTGAFYNRWPSRDDFLDDFLDFALSPDRYPGPGSLFAVLESEGDADFAALVRRLVEVNVQELEESPTVFVQGHLWALSGRRRDVAARLRSLNEVLRDRMVPFYDGLVASMGREYRPPFDAQAVSTMLNALTVGFVEQRAVGEGDEPPISLLAETVLGLVSVWTRPAGSEVTLQGLVGSAMGVAGSEIGADRRHPVT